MTKTEYAYYLADNVHAFEGQPIEYLKEILIGENTCPEDPIAIVDFILGINEKYGIELIQGEREIE